MPDFKTTCPHCNTSLFANDQWIGMEVECPVCKRNFVVEKIQNPTIVPKPVTASTSTVASETAQSTASSYSSAKSLQQYFIESISIKYANWSDRACRKEYWGTMLFLALFGAAIGMIYIAIFGLKSFQILATFIGLITFMPQFSLVMRRLHDIGISGLFLAIIYIFYFCMVIFDSLLNITANVFMPYTITVCIFSLLINIALIVFGCIKGQSGSNQYGPDPLANCKPDQITVQCPNCNKIFKMGPEWIDQRINCPYCRNMFTVKNIMKDTYLQKGKRSNNSKLNDNETIVLLFCISWILMSFKVVIFYIFKYSQVANHIARVPDAIAFIILCIGLALAINHKSKIQIFIASTLLVQIIFNIFIYV